VFIEKGYRRALLTDVGAALGLSHSLLYRYAENKEALFELALRYAMEPDAAAAIEIPVPAPPPGRALELVSRWAGSQARFPLLGAALAADQAGDITSELAGIISECYAFIEHNRPMLALIERSAPDIPELYRFYFTGQRRAYMDQLTSYLRQRISCGLLRPVPDAATAARFVIESVAWFAWHRQGDPDSGAITDEQARQTVLDLLLAALLLPA
jgi:AcrR family transcriptional regulator